MPYLNWKHADLLQEIRPEVDGASRLSLTLGMGGERLAELVPLLREVLEPQGGELRLDLPRGWVVFWKAREGESRLLVAHPRPEEWVATLSMAPADGALFLKRAGELRAGESLRMGECAEAGAVSNLEFIITRVPERPAAAPAT